jgi:DNA-directed RNA polymerase subunit H (RpoH/RPB5)
MADTSLIEVEYDESTKKKIIVENWVKMLYNRSWIKGKLQGLIEAAVGSMDTYDIVSIESQGKTFWLKMVLRKISSIKKVDDIEDFLEAHADDYKFFVVLQGSTKIEKQLLEGDYDRDKMEVFTDEELMINVVDNILVPQHIVLSDEEAARYLKEYRLEKDNLMRIYTGDPIAKYYNIKPKQIVKIIRPSITAGEEIALRLCVPGKIA